MLTIWQPVARHRDERRPLDAQRDRRTGGEAMPERHRAIADAKRGSRYEDHVATTRLRAAEIGRHSPQAGHRPGRKKGPRYLTSAIRVWPTITSGIPLVNSRTLSLTQSAAFSLEANASSALSNMLTVISTSGPPSSR